MAPEHLLQNKNTNALRGKTYSCNSPNAFKYMHEYKSIYISQHLFQFKKKEKKKKLRDEC